MQVVIAFMADPSKASEIDSLELFSGKQAYTRAVLADGWVAIGLDVSYDADDPDMMNFLTTKGGELAVQWQSFH